MARVVIVGGGVAGLATAARLSIKGHNVTVLEQSDQLGGLVQSYARDGFTFELGPTKLTLPAVYRDLFLKTGTSFEDTVDLVEIPDGTRFHWPTSRKSGDAHPPNSVLLPSVGGTAAARALNAALGGSNGDDWRTLTKAAAQMWQIVRPQLIEQQLKDEAELKSITAERDVRKILMPRSSMRKATKKLIKDPRTRQLVESYALFQGADPRTAPATHLTIPYVEQTFGTWWIAGGIHKLVDALEVRCLERGIDIRHDARVTEVVTSASKVAGVILQDGSTIEADIVVWSGAVRGLTQVCRSQALTKLANSAGNRQPSHSMVTILVALAGTTGGIAHDNVFLCRDPDSELRSLSKGQQCSDPTVRVTVAADPSMAPPDHEAWAIQIPAPLHKSQGSRAIYPGLDWTDSGLAESTARRALTQLAAHGIDIAERELWHEVRTPAHIEGATGSPGGSIYGPAPDGWRNTWLKPTIHTPITGLYLIGDSVQPGAGLDRVGMGAELVAESIGRAKRRTRRTRTSATGDSS